MLHIACLAPGPARHHRASHGGLETLRMLRRFHSCPRERGNTAQAFPLEKGTLCFMASLPKELSTTSTDVGTSFKVLSNPIL